MPMLKFSRKQSRRSFLRRPHHAGLGEFLARSHALLQHHLPLHHCHDAIQAAIRGKTETAIISESGNPETPLGRVYLSRAVPIASKNQISR